MPEISIVIPVYNAERYISGCLESILHQSYQNFEIILVDDGSKDGSALICKEYAKKSDRIKLIEQENRGVSAARNVGKKRAVGKYVLFVDADDALHPEMLKTMYFEAAQKELDVTICAVKRVTTSADMSEPVAMADFRMLTKEEAVCCLLQGKKVESGAWNKLFRTELIRNIDFIEGKRINEDKYFVFQSFLTADKISITDEKLYYYFQRQDSVTRQPFSDRLFDSIFFSKRIYQETMQSLPQLEPEARYCLLLSEYTVLRRVYSHRMTYAEEYTQIQKEIKELKMADIRKYFSPIQIAGLVCVKWFPLGYWILRQLDNLRKEKRG